jgi:hypothetical protein
MKQGELERIERLLAGMPRRPFSWEHVNKGRANRDGFNITLTALRGTSSQPLLSPQQTIDADGFVISCVAIRNECLVQFIEAGANDLELLATEVRNLNKRLRDAEVKLGQMRSKRRERSNE